MSTFTNQILLAIAVTAGIVYGLRFLGLIIVKRLRPDHPMIRLATLITYATVSALLLQLILYPQNALNETPMEWRFVALLTALVLLKLRLTPLTVTLLSSILFYFLISTDLSTLLPT